VTTPSRVVVIGSGFAGFYAARTIERSAPPGAVALTIISATAHLCYSPLLPEVAAGRLSALQIAVPLHGALKRARILQGVVDNVDLDARTVTVQCGLDERTVIGWDRLVLTMGSVTRLFPVPGLAEHGLGLKTLVEADYIHDHVLRQLEIAAATDDPEVRRARLTFVVVGAGYAGTETAAQLHLMTLAELHRFPALSRDEVSWRVLDVADSVLPELGTRLGGLALDVLRTRGLRVQLGTSVTRMTDSSVTLSDGSVVPTHTVIWTAGVTTPPLVQRTGLATSSGRLVVDDQLRVTDNVWAAGDAAAARNPFDSSGRAYPPTAQHAQREGVVIGHNVLASLGIGRARRYRHRDLGLVADLGGTAAVARPLGIPLTGIPAKIVTKLYHLYAVPSRANRARIATSWLLNLFVRPLGAQVGLVSPAAARMQVAQHTQPADHVGVRPPAHELAAS
jgi:NADH dehydrogenase